MKCPNCNNPITENDVFCPTCHAYIGCNNVPQEYIQQNSQQQVQSRNSFSNEPDKISIVCCIISCLNPCVGIALYYVWKSQFPHKAKACLISSIISIVLTLAFLSFYLLAVLVAFGKTSDFYNDLNNNGLLEQQAAMFQVLF